MDIPKLTAINCLSCLSKLQFSKHIMDYIQNREFDEIFIFFLNPVFITFSESQRSKKCKTEKNIKIHSLVQKLFNFLYPKLEFFPCFQYKELLRSKASKRTFFAINWRKQKLLAALRKKIPQNYTFLYTSTKKQSSIQDGCRHPGFCKAA